MVDFKKLAAPFNPEDVSWRAQTVIKRDDGYFAMALAYMDARDVMARLDEVCSPSGWSNSYIETAKGRVICTISILCGDHWVSKSDGAGDTPVEGEKGALSDAQKRAAVQWGVGRYLYDMGTPWGACEGYTTQQNGKDKHHFKKWLPSAHAKFRELASKPPGPRRTECEDIPEDDGNAATATNAPAKQESAYVPPAAGFISVDQRVELMGMFDALNVNVQEFCEFAGIKTLSLLSAARFNDARGKITEMSKGAK